MSKPLTKHQRKAQGELQRQQQKKKNEFRMEKLFSGIKSWANGLSTGMKITYTVLFLAAAVGIFTLLNKHEKQLIDPVPTVQYTNQQNVQTNEPVRMVVLGWRALFLFNVPPNTKMSYNIKNITTNDELGLRADTVYGNESTYANLATMRGDRVDAKKNIVIPINPLSTNRITADVFFRRSDGVETEVFRLDTLLPAPEIFTIQKSGLEVVSENAIDTANAFKFIQFIEEGNKILPAKFKIKRIMLGNTEIVVARDRFGDIYHMGVDLNNLFIGSSMRLSEEMDLAKRMISHEFMHMFLNKVRNKSSMIKPYELWMETAGEAPYPKEKEQSVAGLRTLEKNAVISYFDESSYSSVPYFKKYDAGFWNGHPYSNEDELFASGATVLKFFPTEFFKRLEMLEKTDPKTTGVIRKVASQIVKEFGSDRIFQDEVYQKLGLQ